jgi:hypothetical protein
VNTPNYQAGDTLTYSTFGGKPRRIRVTERCEDVKNGRPGFDGFEVNEQGQRVAEYDAWGYDSQILEVFPAT